MRTIPECVTLPLLFAAMLLSVSRAATAQGAPEASAPPVTAAALASEQAAPPTEPRPARRFGAAGEWVITGASTVSAGGYTVTNSRASSTTVTFNPGVDYFVADHFSIGLSIDVAYANTKSALMEQQSTTLGGAVRVGWDIPLSELFSIYPRLSLGYSHLFETYDRNIVYLYLYAPLLLHVTDHLFAGFGPYLRQEVLDEDVGVSRNFLQTSYGGSLVVGGWFH